MIEYCVFETKAGFITIVMRDEKLWQTTLPKQSSRNALNSLRLAHSEDWIPNCPKLSNIANRLAKYFEGARVDFSDIPVDFGSYGAFQAKALQACQKIPYGKLVTYGSLAGLAGSPRAARAVGGAMAKNLTPIIIPCHRVIASGGGIGGFSSGLEWKRTLLKMEGIVAETFRYIAAQ